MRRLGLGVAFFLSGVFALVFAAASTNFILDPVVVSTGGNASTSTSFALHATQGQPVAGIASSPNYINASGFEALLSNGGGGTVLEKDSFPGAFTGSWAVVSGSWTVVGGELRYTAAGPGPDTLRSTGTQTANAWIEVKVRSDSGSSIAVVVFRAQDPSLNGNNQYWVELDFAADQIRLRKDVAGVETTVASDTVAFAAGTTYALKIKFAGDDFRVLLDGVQRLCVSDTSILASGSYGLQARGGSDVAWDDWLVVTASNSVPVTNAGADQNLTGSAYVLLDGTGSVDGDGDPLNFTWSQLSGPAVTLSNATSAAPTFAPAAGLNTYVFRLVVDDCLNAGAPDTVSVTVDTGATPSAGGGGGGGCGLTGLETLILLALLRRRPAWLLSKCSEMNR